MSLISRPHDKLPNSHATPLAMQQTVRARRVNRAFNRVSNTIAIKGDPMEESFIDALGSTVSDSESEISECVPETDHEEAVGRPPDPKRPRKHARVAIARNLIVTGRQTSLLLIACIRIHTGVCRYGSYGILKAYLNNFLLQISVQCM